MREWHSLDFTPTHALYKMKSFDNVTDLMIDGKGFSRHIEDTKKEGAIDKIEKIKEMIRNLGINESNTNIRLDANEMKNNVIALIEDYLSNLKGENELI